MPYITSDYYLNDYKGKTPNDPNDLSRLIERASEVIDNLTKFKLKFDNNLLTSHNIIQSQVEKATAAMVEFYIVNGGYEATLESNLEQVNIGSFSYTMKGNSGNSGNKKVIIPENVISHLFITGLLYSNVGINHEY